MRDSRGWLSLLVIALVIGGLALAARPASDSPSHASDNDGPNGTSALRQLAGALGRQPATVEGSFELQPGGLLFVLTPTVAFTDGEAEALLEWVRQGASVVYAAEGDSPPLERQLAAPRQAGPAAGSSAQPEPGALEGVSRVQGRYVQRLKRDAAWTPILRGGRIDIVGERRALGAGTIVVLTNPGALTNANLDAADNPLFAAALIELAGPGQRVRFDEYHHGAQAGSSAAGLVYGFPAGRALAWVVLVLFVGFAIRGRVVGAPIELHPPARRSLQEHTAAAGRLLQRAGARRLVLEVLDRATRRSLARRGGLALDPGRADFHELLRARDPEAAARLLAVEQGLELAGETDQSLAAAARALHDLAYPVAGMRPPGTGA